MPRSKGRTGRPFRRLRSWVLANFTHCWYCRQPVDRTLPGRHPQGPTVAHLRALCEGGAEVDRDNARLAHLGCNVAEENRRRAERRAQARSAGTPALRPSRAW